MDEKLLNALKVGKMLDSVNRHKKLLYDQYIENSTFYYNGGRFLANAQLCSFISAIGDGCIVLDLDSIPIEIENREDFVQKIIATYTNASENYYKNYTEVSKTIRDNSV